MHVYIYGRELEENRLHHQHQRRHTPETPIHSQNTYILRFLSLYALHNAFPYDPLPLPQQACQLPSPFHRSRRSLQAQPNKVSTQAAAKATADHHIRQGRGVWEAGRRQVSMSP